MRKTREWAAIVLATAGGLFVATAAVAADAPAIDCHLQTLASLDMITQPDGEVAVPVTVNGQPLRLLVDTGDIYSILDSATADALQLHRRRASVSLAMLGNVPITEMVDTDTLNIGVLNASHFGFMIAPAQSLRIDLNGLLGPDIMSNYDVEFDFAHAKFNIFAPHHCAGVAVYWTKTPFAQVPIDLDDRFHISVSVMLDGKPVTALIDSGSDRSIMGLQTAKALFGIDTTSPLLKTEGHFVINGMVPTTTYRYPFATLSLEGISVKNPNIALVPDSAFGRDGPQMILGASILRQLHVYIAYSEHMLYVTPAEAQ